MKIEKKLDKWIFFILKMFPLIYLTFYVLGNMGNTVGLTESDLFHIANSVLKDITFIPIALPLVQIIGMISSASLDNAFISGLCSFLSYYVLIDLLYFVYFFFTFLFRLMRNWMENWG